MEPRRVGALILLALTSWSGGCTAGSGTTSGPDSPPRQSVSPSTRSDRTPTSATSSPTPPDPYAATEATPPYGMFGRPSVTRARDGTTLLGYEPTPAGRTTYRLYDRHWRPLTTLLRVPVELRVERGTASGFVGRATRYRPNGSVELRDWVTIDRAGRLHEVSHQPEKGAPPGSLRPGDLHLNGDGLIRFAYRPFTDTVLRKPRLPWDGGGHSWYTDNYGMICAVRSAPLADGILHTSSDEGRTFTDISLAGILPPDSGPRVQACDTTTDRVIVTTGGEYPRWLHTLDRSRRQLLSSRPLGGQLNPYDWGTLGDGRLVTGTNRGPGVMVATDPTNRLLDYRPTPAPMSAWFDILGDQFVVVGRGGFVHVSTDAGLTWEKFDLQLP